MQQPPRGGASVARADAMAQIALGLSQDRSDPSRPYRDVRISIGAVNDSNFQPALSFGTGSPDLAFAVARHDLDVAAINPSAFLSMAYRGTGPFSQALPLRALAVMPSWDRMAFAVAERTGIESIGDIKARKAPLKISLRGNLSHATRFLIDEVFDAFGFTLRDVESWGGGFQYVDTPSAQERLDGIHDGSLDAVFDEGIKGWGPIAQQNGMRLLPVEDAALDRLNTLGWPVGPLPADRFPGAEGQHPSFSGWPIFGHADMKDDAAYGIARALDGARTRIAFDSEHPVSLEDLCRDNDTTALDVPLHPGAERYYVERGALP
jgi:TRAP-type uncharacterized transport system substrate-binding protein